MPRRDLIIAAMKEPRLLLIKSHVAAYTRKDGTFVADHNDKRTKKVTQAAPQKRHITETENFKKWFRGSRVVDDGGKPLVVYHGTKRDFNEFSGDAPAAHPWLLGDDNKNGFFFTRHAGRRSDSGPWSGAAGYAGTKQVEGETVAATGANVMPVYLAITSPYKMTMAKYREAGSRPDFKEELEVLGYDGVELDDGTFIAFYPEQIKSAIGNSGAFDPKSADMTKALVLYRP